VICGPDNLAEGIGAVVRHLTIIVAAVALGMATPAFGDSLDQTEELPKLSYALTADKVLKEIDRRGPAPVVWELFDRTERWYDLLRNVAGGDPEWLEVAARLRPASDAAATEELTDAVAEAMTISPERVLEMIGVVFHNNLTSSS